MTYVKIFFALHFTKLEDEINDYARNNNVEIVSVSLYGSYAAVVFREGGADYDR